MKPIVVSKCRESGTYVSRGACDEGSRQSWQRHYSPLWRLCEFWRDPSALPQDTFLSQNFVSRQKLVILIKVVLLFSLINLSSLLAQEPSYRPPSQTLSYDPDSVRYLIDDLERVWVLYPDIEHGSNAASHFMTDQFALYGPKSVFYPEGLKRDSLYVSYLAKRYEAYGGLLRPLENDFVKTVADFLSDYQITRDILNAWNKYKTHHAQRKQFRELIRYVRYAYYAAIRNFALDRYPNTLSKTILKIEDNAIAFAQAEIRIVQNLRKTKDVAAVIAFIDENYPITDELPSELEYQRLTHWTKLYRYALLEIAKDTQQLDQHGIDVNTLVNEAAIEGLSDKFNKVANDKIITSLRNQIWVDNILEDNRKNRLQNRRRFVLSMGSRHLKGFVEHLTSVLKKESIKIRVLTEEELKQEHLPKAELTKLYANPDAYHKKALELRKTP